MILDYRFILFTLFPSSTSMNYSTKILETLMEESGSLAQFLADKEKCKAVWGEAMETYTEYRDRGRICNHCDWAITIMPPHELECNHVHYPENCDVCFAVSMGWEHHSLKAFQILQQEGREAALEYIKSTMI